jgi:hypothetical protein
MADYRISVTVTDVIEPTLYDGTTKVANSKWTVSKLSDTDPPAPITADDKGRYPIGEELTNYRVTAKVGNANAASVDVRARKDVTPAEKSEPGEYDEAFNKSARRWALTAFFAVVVLVIAGAVWWFQDLAPATRAQPAPLAALVAICLAGLAAMLVAAAIWLGALDVRGTLRAPPKADGPKAMGLEGAMDAAGRFLGEVKNVPTARLLIVSAAVAVLGVAWIGSQLASNEGPTATCASATTTSTAPVASTTQPLAPTSTTAVGDTGPGENVGAIAGAATAGTSTTTTEPSTTTTTVATECDP